MIRRRTMALAALLALASLGFEWEGRIARLRRQLGSEDPGERIEALEQLARHPSAEVRDDLLRALGDPAKAVRLEAARAAGEARVRDAAPMLLEWLDDPDADVRAVAARALGAIGDPSALPSLVRALGDGRADVRRSAVEALAAVRDDATLVPLLGRLDDGDSVVRIAAVRALAERGDVRAVVPLVARARDDVPEVRTAVATALGDLGDLRAIAALVQALDDDALDVQLAATAALARIGDDDAAQALALRAGSPDERVARASVAALGRMPSPRALAAILDALARPALSAIARDVLRERAPIDGERIAIAIAGALDLAESRTRTDALAASLTELADIVDITPASAALARALDEGRGTPAFLLDALGASGAEIALLPILERLTSEDPLLRGAAITALERWVGRAGPDGRAADPLIEALERAPAAERPALARLLGRIGAPRALPALRALLSDGSAEQRLAAVEAIGALGDSAGTDALLAVLDDRDAHARLEAGRALGRAAGPDALPGLLDRLRADAPTDRHALLVAIAGILARATELPPPLRDDTARALFDVAAAPDRELGSAALSAIAAWGDPALAPTVAALAREMPPARRAPFAATLGSLGPGASGALTELARDEGSTGTVATSRLGEHGDRAIAERLLEDAQSMAWPRSAAAAFSIARLARRGVVTEADAPAICALMRSRDPWTRANLAIAMAALGAGACPEGADPLLWIEAPHAAVVRAAAARWAHAAAERGTLDPARAAAALALCAQDPLPGPARRACREPALAPLDDIADVVAWSADGERVLARTLLALRLTDGTVLVTVSDDAGRIFLSSAPRGPLALDRPASAPLEP